MVTKCVILSIEMREKNSLKKVILKDIILYLELVVANKVCAKFFSC